MGWRGHVLGAPCDEVRARETATAEITNADAIEPLEREG